VHLLILSAIYAKSLALPIIIEKPKQTPKMNENEEERAIEIEENFGNG